MKKLILLSWIFLLPFISYAQEKRSVFFELDGTYWEKSLSYPQFFAPEKNRFGSARLFVGIPIGEKWAIGLLGGPSATYKQQEDGKRYREIYGPQPDENGNPIYIGNTTETIPVGLQSELIGFGAFIQRRINLGEKTSLNINFYGMNESGTNGQLEIFPDYSYWYWWPCPNCLSIAPGPIVRGVEQNNWKAGLDLAFAWSLSPKLDLGLRANFLEFRKQSLKGVPSLTNGLTIYDPNYLLAEGYFGDRYDFGSAVAREGVRLSLSFKPF
ncbi:MAG: hypothetical protein ACQEW9_00800 [Bacteroidota bacterium]